ncbi:hypothetical protein KSP35_17310 [Aquihabitans sp. G128]|uniref:hypothetical protein n=1 Tax=Aquihabitans sp. G128 TaxID=2849779 RepID=UPI001C2392E2|nr:hypothetical protein [Aquihabitans sp. G128]QXC60102.1 hypothetical protein KSP35_17310 [Aquihabitans sp. G128]
MVLEVLIPTPPAIAHGRLGFHAVGASPDLLQAMAAALPHEPDLRYAGEPRDSGPSFSFAQGGYVERGVASIGQVEVDVEGPIFALVSATCSSPALLYAVARAGASLLQLPVPALERDAEGLLREALRFAFARENGDVILGNEPLA